MCCHSDFNNCFCLFYFIIIVDDKPKLDYTVAKKENFHLMLRQGVRRVRDRMVVGFTTTYAIRAYHH
jgi:hypothetical protein